MRSQFVATGFALTIALVDFRSPEAGAAPAKSISPTLPAATNGVDILMRWAPHREHPTFAVCRKSGSDAFAQVAAVAAITDAKKIEEAFASEWPKVSQLLGGHGVAKARCTSQECKAVFTRCDNPVPGRCFASSAPTEKPVPASLFHFVVNSQAGGSTSADNADLRLGLPIASWRAAIVLGYAFEDKHVFKTKDEVLASPLTYEVHGGKDCGGKALFKPLVVSSAGQLRLETPQKNQLVDITNSEEIKGKDAFGERSHATVFLRVEAATKLANKSPIPEGQVPFGYDIQRCTKGTSCNPNDQDNDGKASGWKTVNGAPIFPRPVGRPAKPLDLGKELTESLSKSATGKTLPNQAQLVERAKARINKYHQANFSFAEQFDPKDPDSGPKVGEPYLYRLAVRDLYNQRSKWSVPIEARSYDRQAPLAATNLKATLAADASSVALTWNAASDLPSKSPNSISKYRVYRNTKFDPQNNNTNWSLIATSSTPNAIDKSPPQGTRIWYRVVSVDAANNDSMPSGPAFVLTPIKYSKTDQAWGSLIVGPYGLREGSVKVTCNQSKNVTFNDQQVTVCDPTKGKTTVRWEAPVTSPFGPPKGYRIYRLFLPNSKPHFMAQVATVSGKLEIQDDYAPSQTTAAAYQVRALDPQRNLAAPMTSQKVLIAGKGPPATPLLRKAALSGTDKDNNVHVDLTWDVPASTIATFRVLRTASPNATSSVDLPPVATISANPLKADGLRSFDHKDENPNAQGKPQIAIVVPRLTETSLFEYVIVAHDPATDRTSRSGPLSTAMLMSATGIGGDDLHAPVGVMQFDANDPPKYEPIAKDGKGRQVSLAWKEPSAWTLQFKQGLRGRFVVFRSESPDKNFVQVSKPLQGLRFSDPDDSNVKRAPLQPNTKYYYQVLALTPEGEIGWATPVTSIATTETLAQQGVSPCTLIKPPKLLKVGTSNFGIVQASGCMIATNHKFAGSIKLPNGTEASFHDLEVVPGGALTAVGLESTAKGPLPQLQWQTALEVVTLKNVQESGASFVADIEIELKTHPLRVKGKTTLGKSKEFKLTNVTTEFTGPLVKYLKGVKPGGAGIPSDAPATNDGYLGDAFTVEGSSQVVLTESGLSATFNRATEVNTVYLPTFPAAFKGLATNNSLEARILAFARGMKLTLKNSRIESGEIASGGLTMEVTSGGCGTEQVLYASGALSVSPETGAVWGDVEVRRSASLNGGTFSGNEHELSWSAFILKWEKAQKAVLYVPGGTTSGPDVPKHMLTHVAPSTTPNKHLAYLTTAGGKGLDAGINFGQGASPLEFLMKLPGAAKKLDPTFVDLYVRPSGVGGLLKTPGFKDPYSLYGFPTLFSSIGGSFLQNELAKSEINASVKVPHPRDLNQKGATFDVVGWRLNCACLGNGPTAKTPTPLPYWGAKLTPATLAFKTVEGKGCPAVGDDVRLAVTTGLELESQSSEGVAVRRLRDAQTTTLGFTNKGRIPEPAMLTGSPETQLYVGLGGDGNAGKEKDYAFTYLPTEMKFSDPDVQICSQPWAKEACTSTMEPDVVCSGGGIPVSHDVFAPGYKLKCSMSVDANKAGSLDHKKAGVVGVTGEIKFPSFPVAKTTALVVPAAGGLKKDFVFFDKKIHINSTFGDAEFDYDVVYAPPVAGTAPQFLATKAITLAGMSVDSVVVVTARANKTPTTSLALDAATLPALAWSVGTKLQTWTSKDYGDSFESAMNKLPSGFENFLKAHKSISTESSEVQQEAYRKSGDTAEAIYFGLKAAKQYVLNHLDYATVDGLYGYGIASEEANGDALEGLGGKLTLSVKNVFKKGYASFDWRKSGYFGIEFSTGASDKADPKDEAKKKSFQVFGTKVETATFGIIVDPEHEAINGSMNLTGLSLPAAEPVDGKKSSSSNGVKVTQLGGMIGIGSKPVMAYVGASVGIETQGYSFVGRFLLGGNIPTAFAMNSGILDSDSAEILSEALLSDGQAAESTLTGVYTAAGMSMPLPTSPITCGPMPALFKAVVGAETAFWVFGDSAGQANVGARLYGYVNAEAACVLSATGGAGFAVNAGKDFLMSGRAQIELAINLLLGTWDLGASVKALYSPSGSVNVQDSSATSEWTWAWD